MDILDNEASDILKEFVTEQNTDYQFTPAGMHCHNWAEHAIQTVKNHFIAGLCSTGPNLPLNLWWKLVSQSAITINLL